MMATSPYNHPVQSMPWPCNKRSPRNKASHRSNRVSHSYKNVRRCHMSSSHCDSAAYFPCVWIESRWHAGLHVRGAYTRQYRLIVFETSAIGPRSNATPVTSTAWMSETCLVCLIPSRSQMCGCYFIKYLRTDQSCESAHLTCLNQSLHCS